MPRIALGDYYPRFYWEMDLNVKVVFSQRPSSSAANIRVAAVTSVLILGNKAVLTGWQLTELLIFYTQ